MKPVKWLAFLTVCVFVFLGVYLACSSTPDIITSSYEEDSAQVTSQREAQGGKERLWGFYNVALYPAENRLEIIPNRTAWLTLNVSPFLHGPDGEMIHIDIEILDYEDLGYTGDCKIGVTLSHPFQELSEFCGFDVMGLFMTDGSGVGVENPNLRFPVPGVDPVLLNSDGYTRWMNPTEFTGKAPFGFFDPLSDENSGFIANSTLNAYKYFADGIGPEETVKEFYTDAGNCAQRGLFSYGGQSTRNYDLRFPIAGGEPQILFNYAIIASWNEPVPSPPIHIPDDYPMNANASFPFHAVISDYSTLYYLDESSHGGDVIFDIEIFDWSEFWGPGSLKEKITRVVVENSDGILSGGHWEINADALTFFDGDTMNSNRILLTIPGDPSYSGNTDFLVAIEIDSGYYQGYDEIAPDATMAIYLKPTIEIAACPGAMIGTMSKYSMSVGEMSSTLDLFGSGFVDGPDLSVKLINPLTEVEIEGYDASFIDTGHIRVSFNLGNAQPGVFSIVCSNGCGTESSPPDNLPWWDGRMKVVSAIPKGVIPQTGRIGPYAEVVDHLTLSWPAAYYAQAYRIYIDTDPNSAPGFLGLTDNIHLLDETTDPTFTHDALSIVPFDNHSSYAYVVRSFYDLGTGTGESKNSNIVFYAGQDFDGGALEDWNYVKQYGGGVNWAFDNTGYSGEGLYIEANCTSAYGPSWLVFHSPRIPYISGATNVRFEFNHRHDSFDYNNGYFVGYMTSGLPLTYGSTVEGFTPIGEAIAGAGYNDTDSYSLQNEFQLPSSIVDNYQKTGGGWWGWYFSRFNASFVLDEETAYHITIGMAFDHSSMLHKFNIDDCAVLVY